jgi:hypothetical protein
VTSVPYPFRSQMAKVEQKVCSRNSISSILDNTAPIGAEVAYFPARTPKAVHNLWSSRINMQDNAPRGDEPHL